MKSPARKALVLAVMTAALALSASANGAVLHDQTNSLGANSYTSENFQTSQDALDSWIADDFTVPAGQRWKLSRMEVIGKDEGGPPPFVNIFVYANSGTLPGSELFHRSHIPASDYPNYSAPITGAPSLTSGTYWVSMQEDGGGFQTPSWVWRGRAVQDGNSAVFKGPNGGWGNGCTTYKPLQTCFPTSDGLDMAWKIKGSARSEPVAFGKLKRLADGTAKLTVKLPGPGRLALGGKGVNEASATVTGASAHKVKLKIRATGKAKKSLNAHGTVTVRPVFTYTAGADANPSKTTKKIKLTKS